MAKKKQKKAKHITIVIPEPLDAKEKAILEGIAHLIDAAGYNLSKVKMVSHKTLGEAAVADIQSKHRMLSCP